MKDSRILRKYVMLAILLIATLSLPACRTRITNNSEVSNVKYDETGLLSENYQMRRDELGLGTAEKPLLPDFGSSDEDDETDDDYENESLGPIEEEEEEPYVEPVETPTNTNTNTNTNSGTTTVRRTTPTRRSTSPTTTTTTYVTITFNANGGNINGKSTTSRSVKKGEKIGTLPTPKHTDSTQQFEGWYTSKTGGSKISSTEKASIGKTFYAHWKAPETKYYYITIERANGEESVKIPVKEGDIYTLASDDKPFYKGYKFEGWTGSDGEPYEIGEKVKKELTLTTKWKSWEDKFNEAAEDKKDKKCLILDPGNDKILAFINACKCVPVIDDAEDYDYVIVFGSKVEDAYEEAAANDAYKDKIIALSDKALNSEDEWEQLLYKILLLEKTYKSIKYQDAEKDMKLKADFQDKPKA